MYTNFYFYWILIAKIIENTKFSKNGALDAIFRRFK